MRILDDHLPDLLAPLALRERGWGEGKIDLSDSVVDRLPAAVLFLILPDMNPVNPDLLPVPSPVIFGSRWLIKQRKIAQPCFSLLKQGYQG
jgi:hypothetical protein